MSTSGLPTQCSVCNKFATLIEDFFITYAKGLGKEENWTCTKCVKAGKFIEGQVKETERDSYVAEEREYIDGDYF